MKDLTASSLGAFRDCARKYRFIYNDRRVKVSDAPALAFGHVTHGALEAWWLHGTEAMTGWLKDNAAEMHPQDAAKLTAMLRHYVIRNASMREQYEVVGVEQQFTVPIVNPETGRPMREYQLAGKVDGLLRRKKDGTLWVLEHKTTADEIIGFGTYWQRLAVDHQVSFYVLAHQAAGCLYDVIRKPQLRLSKADEKAADPVAAYQQRVDAAISENVDEYFQQREVVKTDDDIAEAQADLWQQAHILAECEKQNRFPRNSGACRSFFGVCPYLGVCTGCASLDDPTLFRDKAARNEELAA